MNQEPKQFSTTIGGRHFTFETGKLAGQAGGAVTLQVGDTIILATATMSKGIRQGINFLPLTVDFEERMYAGGRIPGSFFRREGRPGEEAILTARLTDRPLRPLFPKDLRNDIQVVLYTLSSDGDTPMDVLAVNAASTAVMISDVPWGGPVGAIRVGRIDGEFVAFPTYEQLERSDLDLRVAGTREAILMVECGAQEVSESVMVSALEYAHRTMQPLIDLQYQMTEQVGKPKREYTSFTMEEGLTEKVSERITGPIHEILERPYDASSSYAAVNELRDEVVAEFAGEDETLEPGVKTAYDKVYKEIVRRRILENGVRPDGRNTTTVRPISCEVNFSPRAHGSGLFTRGETQILTLATLGTPREAQEIDSLSPSSSKRYIHHYNFPPFSTGETRPFRGTSRREVGHGVLAERALLPVIPPETEFPYTLRLVSEALSSNGSTSMGSVCGSTLALMDTGVPIKSPVAGVAMGLIKEGDQHTVLTDILGMEDHLGDMDFKVAGTADGITALQMDIKIEGITNAIMSEALEQARVGRLHILNKMLEVIAEPNPDLKAHTPRIIVLNIPVDKIGAVIGPGGKVIRRIQEETGAKIDIGDEGAVFIATNDGESARLAVEQVEALTESAEIGRIYTGKVVRVADFGAFVQILPNTDGLVHISQLDTQRVEKVEDVVRMGDEITVMVTNIDSEGKVRLSRQAVLEGWTAEEAMERDKKRSSSRGGGNRRRPRR